MGDLELGAAIPEEAVKAAIASCWPSNSPAPSWLKRRVAAELTAALPHIERAVIQRLIEKYEAEQKVAYQSWDECSSTAETRRNLARVGELSTFLRLLRAELAEGGDGE